MIPLARRIRIKLAYDGSAFHGWQVQPGFPTIQGALEDVLSSIEGSRVQVEGSGRTDAGVHAEAQTAAFNLTNPLPVLNLRSAINRLLPTDIRVLIAEETSPDFHPRFDSVAKTYEYRVFRAEVVPPWTRRFVYHQPYPLNFRMMREAVAEFVGEHDFSTFATAADKRDLELRTKIREIYSAELSQSGDLLIFRIRGSGFLKHMVRNLMGSVFEAGKGNLTPLGVRRMLQPGYRGKSGQRAPARGLFLIDVEYPDRF